jgi:hypothetical protein
MVSNEDLADPGDGAKAVEGARVVYLGRAHDDELDFGEDLLVAIDQRQVHLDGLAYRGVGEVFGDPSAVPLVGDLLAEGGQIVLAGGVLDVGEKLGALLHEVAASAQQITGGAHLGRVGVRRGNQAAAQERCDLMGVDLVVLRLSAVNGLHVQGVAQDEGDTLAGAQIGQPVPGEHAFDADHDVLAVRANDGQEVLGAGRSVAVDEDLAAGIEDADVHASGVQVDTAVVSVLLCVESHPVSSFPPRAGGVGLCGAATLPRYGREGGGLDEYQERRADA